MAHFLSWVFLIDRISLLAARANLYESKVHRNSLLATGIFYDNIELPF